jgi:spore maturation protein CgeB
MGTYAADRQPKVERFFLDVAAEAKQRRFLLAGSMYPAEMRVTGNVKRREHVAPQEHAALYSSSRMTLNVTRAEMAAWGYSPSGRFFEAAACGCPMVTDWWEGLESFFDLGRELMVVEGTKDVLRALKMGDTELMAMAQRARERTLEEHTGERRAIEFLAACEEAQELRTASLGAPADALSERAGAQKAQANAMRAREDAMEAAS